MECGTPDKPEVLAITAAMGWDDPDLTFGKLFRVWRWFDQQTTDGNARNVTKTMLDRIVGVSGFADAMAAVNWLVVDEQGARLPSFDKHCGKTAKDRAQTAKRVANHKARAESNADSVSDALPREEKRREEYLREVPTVLVTAEAADDPEEPEKGIPACPATEVVALYHEVLPELPRVERLTSARRAAMRQRWREWAKEKGWQTSAEGMEDWRKFFVYIRGSPFLMGRAKAQPGKRPFVMDFDFLMTASSHTKIFEGKYHEVAA